jgi:prepilin-type N-terminal cleavage/methylation domain-containing protein
MQKQTIKSKQEGFTIIEVLIVLAIAALILLVVFLAVPGLQRSQANNSAKNDATKISAAITSYLSNNSSSTAVSDLGKTAATVTTVCNDMGSTSVTKLLCGTPVAGNGGVAIAAPANAVTEAGNGGNWVSYDLASTYATNKLKFGALSTTTWATVIVTDAQCGSTTYGGGNTIYGAGTGDALIYASNKIALVYTTQTANGMAWNCLQAQ